MKKQLFWMIGAALALTSCSNDEQVAVNPGNEITFRTAVQTRTLSDSIYTTEKLQKRAFKVTAYFVDAKNTHETAHIEDDIFTYNNDLMVYTGTKPHYWLPGVTSLEGQAWAPISDEVTLTTNARGNYTYTVAVNSTVKEQKDFITANITTENAGNPGENIALNFKHQLAQIVINVENKATDYTLKVKKARLGNVLTGADNKNTFTITIEDAVTENWTVLDGSQKINYDSEETVPDNIITSSQNVMKTSDGKDLVVMLFPQTIPTSWDSQKDDLGTTLENNVEGSYIALLAQITETGTSTVLYPYEPEDKVSGDDWGWIVVPLSTNTISVWEKGKKYAYTLSFDDDAAGYKPNGSPVLGKPIRFTVNEFTWDENNSSVGMTTTATD